MSTLKKVLGWLKPHSGSYALVCGLGLIGAFLEMIPPRLIGDSITTMSSGSFSLTPILWSCGIWAAISIVGQLMHGVQISLANRSGELVLGSLRMRIFAHLQRLPVSYFDRTHIGRILMTQTNDLDSIRNLLCWGLNTFVANLAIMIMAATMLYLTDSTLFFATVWLFPAMAVLNFLYGNRVTRAWEHVRSRSSLVGSNQAENIAGVRVVAAFNRQETNLRFYNELQDANTEANVGAARKSGLFQPVLQWVNFIGVGIILVFGAYRVSHGTLKPGQLVSLLLYWDWFMRPAVTFGGLFNEMLIAFSGADRVIDLLEEKAQEPETVRELPPVQGSVQFDDVHFHYDGSKRQILKGIDMEVPAGSVVALVGETGSGKSTIISLLSKFYSPTSGKIRVDGHDLAEISSESLHRQMAMVLQTNFLFAGTVMDNLRCVRPEATDAEIFEAARTLGCHEIFSKLKHGYHTAVGERGTLLSLGERQLVCLTRALVADPRILLLDEATSALDAEMGHRVQKAMKRLVRGRTAFIVTHRLSTTASSDLILVIEQGKVVERGTHAALLRRSGKYSELYRNSFLPGISIAPVAVDDHDVRIENRIENNREAASTAL